MGWLLYVIGYPGCGKTTAMKTALATLSPRGSERVERKPFAHTIHGCGLVELGYDRETYGGTDTLPLNVQPKVVEWMNGTDVSLVIAEGDRLANPKFFDAVWNLSEREARESETVPRRLCLVYIKCPELKARQRAWERGSRFNESWLKGRISKVDNLVNSTLSERQSRESDRVRYEEIDGTEGYITVGAKLAEIIEGLNG